MEKLKYYYQGLVKGKISSFNEDNSTFAQVEILENIVSKEEEINSLIDLLRAQVKKLSRLNSKFPADLIKTIDEKQ